MKREELEEILGAITELGPEVGKNEEASGEYARRVLDLGNESNRIAQLVNGYAGMVAIRAEVAQLAVTDLANQLCAPNQLPGVVQYCEGLIKAFCTTPPGMPEPKP